MNISTYWVGQIPAKPIPIDVKDTYGRVLNLSGYTEFNVKMVGSDNEEIDLEGAVLSTAGITNGRFVFYWPTDRSVFDKTGEYVLQLELIGPNARDYTTEHYIKVRRLGGVN